MTLLNTRQHSTQGYEWSYRQCNDKSMTPENSRTALSVLRKHQYLCLQGTIQQTEKQALTVQQPQRRLISPRVQWMYRSTTIKTTTITVGRRAGDTKAGEGKGGYRGGSTRSTESIDAPGRRLHDTSAHTRLEAPIGQQELL